MVFRRRNKFAGKQSYKNVVETSGGLAAATTSINVVATAVELGLLDQDLNEVPVGAQLSAIYYSVFIFTDAGAAGDPTVDMFWFKNPAAGFLGGNAPTPGDTGSAATKRFIIHEEKGLAGNRQNGTPMVVKGVVRLPSKLARFGLSDRLELHIRSVTAGFFCAKHIYRASF